MKTKETQQDNYMALNNTFPEMYKNYKLPKYLLDILPKDKEAKILDIGCGFGQMLLELKLIGFKNLEGIDISRESYTYCKNQKLNVKKIKDLKSYCKKIKKKYDFIIMSHVLEHIKKDKMVSNLKLIKDNLLSEKGKFFIAVPNAQSNTGAYWFFDDFTHEFLFTARSLNYVLNSAGFENIVFLDKDAISHLNSFLKIVRKTFLFIYRLNIKFWNKVTSSSYHINSPIINSFELKVLAEK